MSYAPRTYFVDDFFGLLWGISQSVSQSVHFSDRLVLVNTAAGDAVADGAVLSTTISALAGVASGAAAADGDTLTVGAVLIDGVAVGGSVLVEGRTLVATMVLVSGVAVGEGLQPQDLVGLGRYLLKLRRRVVLDGEVIGEVLRVHATIIPGRAVGSALSPAGEAGFGLRLVSGIAVGGASTLPRRLQIEAGVVKGTATGDRNFYDDEMLVLLEAA